VNEACNYCVETALGNFELQLCRRAAPKTSRYFEELADVGLLDDTAIFRIVSINQPGNIEHPIEVVQWGNTPDMKGKIPTVDLVTTRETGLSHRRWSVSTARFAEDEAYGSFFVCMRDEPALDFGGQRNPDGKGFAVFAVVNSGFELLEDIFALAERSGTLNNPVPILRVHSVS